MFGNDAKMSKYPAIFYFYLLSLYQNKIKAPCSLKIKKNENNFSLLAAIDRLHDDVKLNLIVLNLKN